jgi:tetratricopeptide (TPR) repeat protein
MPSISRSKGSSSGEANPALSGFKREDTSGDGATGVRDIDRNQPGIDLTVSRSARLDCSKLPLPPVPRSQRNDNFIDKSFTVMADLILKVLPTNRRAKEAFAYYRDGMSAQADGEYAEALENYQEALKLEDDPNDKAFILYNMALVFASNGEHAKALDFYSQALELNSKMPQALNNMAVIHHHLGSIAEEQGDADEADRQYDQAADFWGKAIRLAPNNYIEALNWLKTSGRGSADVYF